VTAVMESARHELVQDAFAEMPKWRVTKVVTHADGLYKVLVKVQGACDRAANLGDLKRMCKPRHIVIAYRRYKNLALVLHAPERVRVNDPITVALERRPDRALFFGDCASRGVRRADGERRKRTLALLKPLSYPV
jgi:hypothetical protein